LSNKQLPITRQQSLNKNRSQDNEKTPFADNIYEMMAVSELLFDMYGWLL